MHSEIKQIDPPSIQDISTKRSKDLTAKIINIVEKSKKLGPYQKMVANIVEQEDIEPEHIAAALVYLLQQTNPMPESEITTSKFEKDWKPSRFSRGRSSRARSGQGRSDRGKRQSSGEHTSTRGKASKPGKKQRRSFPKGK